MEDQEIAQKIADLSPEEQQLYRYRHSLAHIMAQAVIDLFGREQVKLGIGPPVEDGFYYDFDLAIKLEEKEHLPQIEKKMKEIIKARQEFQRVEMNCTEARKKLEALGEPYKVELVNDLEKNGVSVISFYENGPFLDMCEGPHIRSTKDIPKGSFKLDRVAGAYWRGSEKNKMLTRIYGLAFESPEKLKDYEERRALALERDHRKLNKEQEYFLIEDTVGKGLPLWLPHGTAIRDELEKLARETEFKAGYQRVCTPHITKKRLYEISGHLSHYTASMFPPMKLEEEGEAEPEIFYLKPMNCPHHHLIFGFRPRSYRELPLRLAEYGQVYRYEKSGELSGLLRVRGMCMNDAHIYCREDQLKEEFKAIMKMHAEYYKLFGMSDYFMRLSLHDPKNTEKFVEDPELWQKAENYVKDAMDEIGMPYKAEIGEAAFYGPKIDVQFKNVVGREETASTNQVDFVMAKRFNLEYRGEDGQMHRPVIIHRAPLGTHERFISFLIEHYGGAFPTWLAPVQVRLLTITERQMDFAQQLQQLLVSRMVRVELDDSSESFNKKIRKGTIAKIPILVVIGEKEVENNQVTLRRYQQKKQVTLQVDTFLEQLSLEIQNRIHVVEESA